MSNILTTHVGSLPRSKELSDFLFAKDKGEKFSQSSFDEVLKNNVESVVKKQLDVGTVSYTHLTLPTTIEV